MEVSPPDKMSASFFPDNLTDFRKVIHILSTLWIRSKIKVVLDLLLISQYRKFMEVIPYYYIGMILYLLGFAAVFFMIGYSVGRREGMKIQRQRWFKYGKNRSYRDTP